MTALQSIPFADDLLSSSHIFPPGLILAYAGASAPTGWLICDGEEVAATHTALISVLTGNPYGAGPNSRPRVPDLRGRLPLGASTMGVGTGSGSNFKSGVSRGTVGGTPTHPLTAAETAIRNHAHNVSGGTTEWGAGLVVGATNNLLFGSNSQSRYSNAGYSAADGFYHIGNHSHTFSVTSGNPTSGEVSGTAHENMPPNVGVFYIIKT